MSTIEFEDKSYPVKEGHSVLDTLLDAGEDIPNGCRAGACQSCLMISEEEVPATAQVGLNESQKQLGYFLSCQCKPASPIRVRKPGGSLKSPALVLNKSMLNDKVLRLTLKSEISFRPGQYFTLWKNESTARSYSAASLCNEDNAIEFHIKKIDQGAFSHWASTDLKDGDQISIQGPLGQCFYNCTDLEQPILMASIGTGLAPIYGILKEALNKRHQGKIDLLIGAKQAKDFYLQDELALLEGKHQNLNIHWIAQDFENSEGDIYRYCKTQFPDLKGYKLYLCGAESFVKKMKKQGFLGGANMGDIHADPFVAFGS